MDALEALETCQAMRWIKSDPVPDDLLRKVIFYATRASNPGNCQPWEFLIVRDAAKRAALGEAIAPLAKRFAAMPRSSNSVEQRMREGASHLSTTFANVPALIFVCVRN